MASVFQLVLQVAPWDAQRFSDLIALEDELISVLSDAEVDGHDAGSGEANIFIIAERPRDVFQSCLPVIQQSAFTEFSAAFRELESETFERLWPPHERKPFTVK